MGDGKRSRLNVIWKNPTGTNLDATVKIGFCPVHVDRIAKVTYPVDLKLGVSDVVSRDRKTIDEGFIRNIEK